MKSTIAILMLAAGSVASAQTISHRKVNPNVVIPVATALNHISLIELPEPITRAAVGSDDVHIEWHGNTLALKPVQQGKATNLFIWTEHTQTSYEILPPGDVKNAAFVIDEMAAVTPAASQPHEAKFTPTEIQKAADTLISQTMLQSTMVNNHAVKNSKDRVSVRITEVVRDKDALYVRYTMSNRGKQPYRVSAPQVFRFTPSTATDVLGALKGRQIPDRQLNQLGGGTTATLPLREARVSDRDVNPGQTVDGVLCFQAADTEAKPEIYRFVFAKDQKHPVDAAAVL